MWVWTKGKVSLGLSSLKAEEFPEAQVDLGKDSQVKEEGGGGRYVWGREGLMVTPVPSPACAWSGSGHSGIGRNKVLEPLSGRTSYPWLGVRTGRRVFLGSPVPAAGGLSVCGCCLESHALLSQDLPACLVWSEAGVGCQGPDTSPDLARFGLYFFLMLTCK